VPTLPPGLSPGTIPYTGSGTDTAAERLAGYAVAMRAAGLEPHTIEGGFRSEAAHEAVRRPLDQSALPAALLVSNNWLWGTLWGAVTDCGRCRAWWLACACEDELIAVS
jgi:DNA-binding LacI/PurR family transcriptional regulator